MKGKQKQLGELRMPVEDFNRVMRGALGAAPAKAASNPSPGRKKRKPGVNK